MHALEMPEYRKISTWTGFLAIAVALTGIIAQGVLYEIKSANAEKDLQSVLARKDSVDKEAKALIETRRRLVDEIAGLQDKVNQGATALEQISDDLKSTGQQAGSNASLDTLQEAASAAALDLRAALSPQPGSNATEPLSNVVARLFDAKASQRGAAYNSIMKNYSQRADLVATLLKFADANTDNENGIYNTLVVLGHLNYSSVPAEMVQPVREFSTRMRDKGPKTAARADVVLKRLPG
ncbi:MAG: hypothetical protein EOO05_18315 [Chitinophagaceae bacterium]|nr:MAG: hypothetical protein EOO05_18315 [Chitinophagaceae bacterium]